MKIKDIILEKHKYTNLVFFRINKKLKLNLNNLEIEKYMYSLIDNTKKEDIIKKGKNWYVHNRVDNVRITVNSHSYTIITVDAINKF